MQILLLIFHIAFTFYTIDINVVNKILYFVIKYHVYNEYIFSNKKYQLTSKKRFDGKIITDRLLLYFREKLRKIIYLMLH